MENLLQIDSSEQAGQRYSRQRAIPGIGKSGQIALSKAKVLIIGAGGLGSPAALYLAAAGVGTVGVADDDSVSWSNLNRQILYDETNIGCKKVAVAAGRLRQLNGSINIVEHYGRVSSSLEAREMIAGYDIVIDACDNVATRYLVGDITSELNIPYIYGAIEAFNGQIAVFNYGKGEQRKRYRDLWPVECAPVEDKSIPSIGVTAGIIGTLQANEAIKIICGVGNVLCGKLFTIDLLTLDTYNFSIG